MLPIKLDLLFVFNGFSLNGDSLGPNSHQTYEPKYGKGKQPDFYNNKNTFLHTTQNPNS